MDAIAFRENDGPIAIPGARDLLIVDLPRHSKLPAARAVRNLRRYLLNRPPLVDRFSGFNDRMAAWLDGRGYDVIVVEHFWCAPYARVLRAHTKRLVLDLHNIESMLHRSSAGASRGVMAAMHRRFAGAYARLEREWLPRYDDVLVTSTADGARIDGARITVYPNTIGRCDEPVTEREHAVVFTGNLEYGPNLSAVRWFAAEIWPLIRRYEPELEWRLVGRNADAVQPFIKGVAGVRAIGEVPDAIAEIGRAKAAVVPLLSGSGTRFKILEAWAAATPVISTSIGAEGLEAIDGEHLVIADDAKQFAGAVVETIRNPTRLGRNGREFLLDRYTSEAGWRALAGVGL